MSAESPARVARREIRAVLFDMDGVLVDVSGSYRRAILNTAAHFGRAVTADDVQRLKDRGGFNDDWKLTYALLARRSFSSAPPS